MHTPRRLARSMGLFTVLLPALLAGVVPGARADVDVTSLVRRLDEQEARIRLLEARLKAQDAVIAAATPAGAPGAVRSAAAVATAAPPANLEVSPPRIALTSPNGETQIRLHGEFTLDGRFFTDGTTSAGSRETWLIRRARPIVDGTFGGLFDFRFNPDFAGGKTVIQDAYVAARFESWAVFTAGKFKQPFGLERLQPSANNRFMELGLPSDLVPNRDIGVQFSGSVLDNRVSYQLGWFNGAQDGVSSDANVPPDVDNNNSKDAAARVLVQPFLASDTVALRGLSIGLAASYANQTGSASNTLLPSYRTEGQRPFFAYDSVRTLAGLLPAASPTIAAGRRMRLSPQLTYYEQSLGVLAEYVRESQDVRRSIGGGANLVTNRARLDHETWQVYSTYLLTGEKATYATVVPNEPLAIGKAGWGAWELALRYSTLNLDPATFGTPSGVASGEWFADPTQQARALHAWTAGLNWYLTANVGWMLDYGLTKFSGGAGTPGLVRNRGDERWLFTRFQVNY